LAILAPSNFFLILKKASPKSPRAGNKTYLYMRKSILNFVLAIALVTTVSSCYTYTFNVGEGAQSGVTTVAKNHYLIYGLAPINVSDPTEIANGAENYQVKIEHSFIDGLLAAITFGIYTPTTTTITR
jgi:hypothetical protein